ncbi:MAG: DUF1553 domain-containing protein [Verrucomicrobia bacterium]|nr:DUF1553 domain-containing protein [Verrucomicrobiota bacterium]
MLSTRLVSSSPRRLGSLRHSRQGCLRDHDKRVTDNLWRHLSRSSCSPGGRSLRGRDQEKPVFETRRCYTSHASLHSSMVRFQSFPFPRIVSALWLFGRLAVCLQLGPIVTGGINPILADVTQAPAAEVRQGSGAAGSSPQSVGEDFDRGSPVPKLRSREFELTSEDRSWWAFQPLRAQRPPEVRSLTARAHPIDRFWMSRLEGAGMAPNPEAPPRELMRRAYFDLIGLPPKPEEMKEFLDDRRPDAWERLIDRLLARPEYGERWARRWLDLVRFAESNGYERDGPKPHAWRYRDYVVQSFDRDKPYNQFILEQLAGDELDEQDREEAVVATGFYRLHVWDDEPDSTLAAEFDDLDDVMVTTGAAFLGLTLGCARCHDHKYDPISQKDYYRTLAYFRSINPYGLHKTGGGGRGTGRIIRPLAEPEKVRAWELAKAEAVRPLQQALEAAATEDEKKRLRTRIQDFENRPPFGYALAVHEDPIKPTHVFRRGDVLSPGEEVQPGVPEVFRLLVPEIVRAPGKGTSGRRLAFARWVVHPENPLTARVLVNRLWQHHFGRGLVETPNDFGQTGSRPSDPDLLDYLAGEFLAGGWSIKRAHRLIMTSAAYRASSRSDHPVSRSKDEANRYFWRQNPRRMEAEVMRDSMLAVSGDLELAKGGPSFFSSLPKEVHRTQDSEGKGWQTSPPREQSRRSIYTFVKRALLTPLLESFDYTTTTVPVGERAVTTVAAQALTLLNDAFVRERGARLAARLDREAGQDPARRIQRAFELALQRRPAVEELDSAQAWWREQRQLAEAKHPAEAEAMAWQAFCVALFNLNEFVYVD